ncbi:MAG: hypothetical protein HC896_13610 [Bacteroidales bacterium]|nr:hypothetical protein [Bacteroidales bacterium]
MIKISTSIKQLGLLSFFFLWGCSENNMHEPRTSINLGETPWRFYKINSNDKNNLATKAIIKTDSATGHTVITVEFHKPLAIKQFTMLYPTANLAALQYKNRSKTRKRLACNNKSRNNRKTSPGSF